MTGVLLLLFTLLMGFTGQLLRWDQTAVWSVVIAAEQAGRVPFIGDSLAHFIFGGDTVGGATLSRFFAIHVFLVPACIFLFVGIHLYLVLHNGISEPPVAGVQRRPGDVPRGIRGAHEEIRASRSGPTPMWRDVVFSVAVIAVIACLAAVVGPPDARQAARSGDHRRLPAARLVPALVLRRLRADAPEDRELRHHRRRPSSPAPFSSPSRSSRTAASAARGGGPGPSPAVVFSVMMVGSLWIEGARAPWSPNFDAEPLTADVVGATTGPVADGRARLPRQGVPQLPPHRRPRRPARTGPLAHRQPARRATTSRSASSTAARTCRAFAGNMSPEELTDLVAFLLSRTTPGAPTQESGAAGIGMAQPP